MAEPAQLAHRLVAAAPGAEAVELGLGGHQRVDGRGALARGRQRLALGESCPRRGERRTGRGLARGGGRRHGLARDARGRAARPRAPGASTPSPSAVPARAAAASPCASASSAAPMSPRGELRLDEVGRRERALDRQHGRAARRRRRPRSIASTARSGLPAAVSAAPEAPPGWPAAWKPGRDRRSRPASARAAAQPATSPAASRAEARALWAHSSMRGMPDRRASSTPSSPAATASARRPSSISVATDSTVSSSRTLSRPVSAARADAALEVRERRVELPERVPCAAVHPESGKPRRQLLAAEPLERGGWTRRGPSAPSGPSAAVTRARAPPASAAASKTGSPIARASSRASLTWAARLAEIAARTAPSGRARAAAGCDPATAPPAARRAPPGAGAAPRSLPPSHHSALASGDGEPQPLRRPGGAQRFEQRLARRRRVAGGGLRLGEQRLQPGSARGVVGSVGQQPQRGGVERGRGSPAPGTAARRRPRSSRSMACSSPGRAACSTWWARSTGPAPRRSSARAARACAPRRQPWGVAP